MKEMHEEDKEEEEDGEADLDLKSASDWFGEEDAVESTERERLASMPESDELRLTGGLATATASGERARLVVEAVAVGCSLW